MAIAGVFVVLSTTYAIRSALVNAYVKTDYQAAANIWEEHPDVLAGLSLAAIADASAHRKRRNFSRF